jgi:putative ABC transport system permease protein
MEGHSPEDRSFVPVHTYLRLKPGANIQNIRARMPEFTERHWSKEFASGVHANLLPITDIHLSPDAHAAFKPRGNPRALQALTLVAVLIVFVAVVNFVNLTTARAAQRGIEVGVRKLAGARRSDLALQFTGESLIYVTIAMLLAISLVELALPAFRALIDPGVERYAPPSIAFDYWREPALLAVLAGATLLVGLIAAAYPAAVLSSFLPATVLKGAALPGGGGARVRQSLVVLQFATLIGLIFATVVIYRQTQYALNSALRIDTNQVVIYNLGMEMQNAGAPAPAFVAAVERTPGVLGMTRSMGTPTNSTVAAMGFSAAGGPNTIIKLEPVDYDFFDFYRIPLLAGRGFSPQHSNDQFLLAESARPISVIVNEAAARKLGFSRLADLPGKELKLFSWAQAGVAPPQSINVIGVVADFPIDSIRREIEPTLYFVFETPLTMLSIRISGQHIPETMRALNDAWKRVGQPRAQEGWLLDGYYRTLYADIILQQKTLSLFAGCAVFLAALGLFGLSIYTAQRRTKEIGIRKVMGASTADVMRLLLWAFTKPVLWASLIAWPLAAWLMNRWLEGFAYRVPLGWWWLPVATLAALGIALATVSAHSYAVARQQPANALRYE